MRLKKKTKVKGDQVVYSKTSKKDIEQLKAAYKSGKLKFNSKEIAESILKDFRRGLSK